MPVDKCARLQRLPVVSFFLAGVLISTGCGGGAPTLAAQPQNQSVTTGQTVTFSVTAAGTAPLALQWQKGQTPIPGATLTSYTTPPASTFDSGSKYSVVVSNPMGMVTSQPATLTVKTNPTDVLTHHNDIARTGQNLAETSLTPSNVNSASFGKLGQYDVDGLVDAEPLYASNVTVPGLGKRNLLIVSTEHDSVYAFDADSAAVLWRTSTLGAGETSFPTIPDCPTPGPEIGVTSTPVIDRTRGPNGTIYLVAMSAKSGDGPYHQRLHALDLALGTELFGGPVDIEATFPGTGDNTDGTNVVFDPAQYTERSALLLSDGVIYTAWASHCDRRPFTGWVMGYSAATLAQKSVLNLTPNAFFGAIWMAGAGPAADSSGNIYFAQGNGISDTTRDSRGFPQNGNYGNAFMKLSTSAGLAVADYFEMNNVAVENNTDLDLGSGGVVLLPDLRNESGNTMHLALCAGKDANIYVVNRDSLGKFSATKSSAYQTLTGVLPGGVWTAPAYFNNTVYYGSATGPIRAFAITNATLSSKPTAQTSTSFVYPGATPSISANGTRNGIVWAVERSAISVLHAYDATALNELYNSNQAAGSRDQFGQAPRFTTPTIVNGKVFVGTTSGVAVFGLLPK